MGRVASDPVDLDAAGRLPDWSRAHIVAHLIGNAAALVNLLTWASTGVETPMYASPDARGAQIAADATRPEAWLRERLAGSSAELLAKIATVDEREWSVEVRTAQGRTVPASEVPFMRVRESYIHLVDLAVGFAVADFPAALVDALLDDVTAFLGTRPACPTLILQPSDRERSWQLGPGKGSPWKASPGKGSEVIESPAAALLGWLIGRPGWSGGEPRGLPELPRWL